MIRLGEKNSIPCRIQLTIVRRTKVFLKKVGIEDKLDINRKIKFRWKVDNVDIK